MFTIQAGRTRTYCDGLSRRSFLKVGVAGMASVSLADVLRAKAESAALGQARQEHFGRAASGSTAGRATWTCTT